MKAKDLYRILSAPKIQSELKLDSGETLALARELLYLRRGIYEQTFPELKARSLIPVSNEIDPAADTHSFASGTSHGTAKVGGGYKGPAPRVESDIGETIGKIEPIRQAYAFDIMELRQSQRYGRPIQARKATDARAAMERALEDVAAKGANSAFTGLLNNANCTVDAAASLPNGSWVQGTTTGEQMVQDLHKFVQNMIDETLETEQPTDLLLAPSKFGMLSTTVYNATSGDMTALTAFLNQSPWVKRVRSWNRCKGAGVGNADRAVAYKPDPSKLVLDISQEFEQFAPQQEGLEFVTDCHMRVAGVSMFKPKSVRYCDDI
jgi:hypothetical protein